ncbi:hypothetical protein GTA08_BOTSDO07507 [Botryosphaeria dothidea]|uniref:Uncharacterized protein n=1 Tax=Botryosphaeria dothidea TaxID=55169 RepID=A0A8H4N036_9PEZI|nr:hypothetical protein GTA08_BOTSDO07507 [Botryosphaeria dothidea]
MSTRNSHPPNLSDAAWHDDALAAPNLPCTSVTNAKIPSTSPLHTSTSPRPPTLTLSHRSSPLLVPAYTHSTTAAWCSPAKLKKLNRALAPSSCPRVSQSSIPTIAHACRAAQAGQNGVRAQARISAMWDGSAGWASKSEWERCWKRESGASRRR